MKVKITKMETSTSNNKPIVDAWGRSECGRKVHLIIEGIQPYFYVDVEPMPHQSVVATAQEGMSIHNIPLYKITTSMPDQIPDVRKHYHTHYEGDILYHDRVRYDCGIKSVINIPDNDKFFSFAGHKIYPSEITSDTADIETRYWVIDIETSDVGGFAEPKYPTAEVLSWSVYDSYTKTIYACISKQVDKDKVIAYLKNKKFLKKNTDSKKDPEPFDGKIEIYCVSNEYKLFHNLTKLFNKLKPDYIIGWNSINYDIPYLIERAGTDSKRVVNVKDYRSHYPCPKFSEISQLDLMEKFRSLYKAKKGELESAKLEFCAISELGYGKLKHDSGFYELYKNKPEKFLAYNIWDTVVSERINISKGIMFYYTTLAEQAGTTIENTEHFSLMIDALILHRLNGIVVLPSRSSIDTPKEIEGAYTHKPSTGLLENVVVIDFKQQYPGAIRSLNMSPETIVNDDVGEDVFVAPSGNKYRKTPRGLLPMILDELSATRDDMKKEMKRHEIGSPEYKKYDAMQTAYKFFMNSFYGIMATGKGIFRLTDQRIGYDIPDTARALTKYTIKLLQKSNIKIVYGDTDSCLFQFPGIEDPEIVLSKSKKLVAWLNKKYNSFVKKLGNTGEPHWFNIDLELIYDVYFQSGRLEKGKMVGKKRYAGLKSWQDNKWLLDKSTNDRMVIKGYEVRRSNASTLTRELQKKVLMMILERESPKKIRELIKNIIDDVRKNPGADLGLPTGIQKTDYEKGIPIHVRAMMYSNDNLGYNFKRGDKPLYFYGHVKGKPKTDVFAIDWGDKLPEGAVIDVEHMIERCIKGPLEPIIEGLGYSWSDLIGGKSISKQEKLF